MKLIDVYPGDYPSPEQAAEMSRLQTRVGKAARVMAGLLFIAVAAIVLVAYVNSRLAGQPRER